MTETDTGKNSGSEFALLVDAVQDYALLLLSPEGEIRTWNSGANRIMGYTAREAVGRHFSIFYPPEVVQTKPKRELEIASVEGRVEDEGWRLRKDGSRFWASTIITALRDEWGTLQGFAKITRDLTERRMADERLRQSEEMFRLLVQSVKDYAIFMLDPTGRIVTWNEGAERIKGYTRDEIVGQHFSIFYPEEDIVAGKPERELETASREGMIEDEGWRIRKDGSRFFANVIITAIFDAAGRLRGFTKVTRDISERRRAEELRRAMLEQREARLRAEDAKRHAENSFQEVQEISRAKDEFVMTLSHELRTPLTSILGWARLLPVMSPTDPAFRSAVEAIGRAAQMQARLLDDVLDTSRMISGKMRLNIEPTDVGTIVRNSAESVQAAAAAKNIGMEMKVGPDAGIVQVDPTRLQQIIWNLLTNAIKFTPAGGLVTLIAARSGESLHITVTDTGEGIQPNLLPYIFEPFRQGEQTASRMHGGLGLGLSIVRHLVEAHGGKITASSPGRGKGATFKVVLPARAIVSDDAQVQPVTRPGTPAPLTGVKVLVVDDDRDGREFLRSTLSQAGATVVESEGTVEALASLERGFPDVIVTDVAMPELDGYEFARRLRASAAASLPVIALSAFPREAVHGASDLFTDYLAKPIEPEELITALARSVHKRAAR